MSRTILSEELLRRALAVPDLTDPRSGPHALQLLVEQAVAALCGIWRCDVVIDRQSPIVSVADNYDNLHYPPDGAARDARYTRYVSEDRVLRTQTSAMIPALLRRLAGSAVNDQLLVCPGLVYRRDCIDRLHSAEPHQLDLWRVSHTHPLGRSELQEMIACVLPALLPGRPWRSTPAVHPSANSWNNGAVRRLRSRARVASRSSGVSERVLLRVTVAVALSEDSVERRLSSRHCAGPRQG